MFLNAVLCFRLKLHLPCGSANLFPHKLHKNRINSVHQKAAKLHHVVFAFPWRNTVPCNCNSVTHLLVIDWFLVLNPAVSRSGLKTGFVNFCTLQSQLKRNLLMFKWQRLVWHRHVTFKNYITILGLIFISEIPNCEGNFLVKEDYMRKMRLVCFVGSVAK